MRGNLSNKKRTVAGIMSVLMLVAILFSAFLIAVEADHDCTGDDCAICACIRQCEKTLHQFGDRIPEQATAILPTVFLFMNAILLSNEILQGNPVSRKVRLND